MKSHRLPGRPRCVCGFLIDGATGIAGQQAPEPGDLTACYNCGQLMTFGHDLRLVPTTDDALEGLPSQLRVALERVVAAIKARGLLEPRSPQS